MQPCVITSWVRLMRSLDRNSRNTTNHFTPFHSSSHRTGDVPGASSRDGRHRHVGVLIHPDHKAYAFLQKLDPAAGALQSWQEPEQENEYGPDPDNWMAPLLKILDLEKVQGYLYAFLGYIHQEIIPYMVFTSKDKQSRIHYLKHVKSLYPPQLGTLLERMETDDRKERDILVFDLADRNRSEIKNLIGNRGFRVLSIPHNIAIPVGIGFSLHMLDDLLKQDDLLKVDHWEILSKAAIDCLGGNRRELNEIGIEFDPYMVSVPDIPGEILGMPSFILSAAITERINQNGTVD